MFFLFIFVNLIFYILGLKIFFLIFKNKYFFPFRISDIANFLFCITTSCLVSYNYFGRDFIVITIILNINYFYIFYHLINMIMTSPRTKILLYLHKYKKIKLSKFKKIYNNKKILEIRIKRLKSSNQIKTNKNTVEISENSFLLKIVIFIFNIVKKF